MNSIQYVEQVFGRNFKEYSEWDQKLKKAFEEGQKNPQCQKSSHETSPDLTSETGSSLKS